MPSPLVRSSFFFAIALLQVVGCGKTEGPELAAVTGTVTLDDKPLPGVNITFVPEKEGGSPSFGGTDASGKYRLLFNQDRAGAMTGKHRVEITVPEPDVGEDSKPAANTVVIPKKYSKPGALTAEVKAGSNKIDFPLASK